MDGCSGDSIHVVVLKLLLMGSIVVFFFFNDTATTEIYTLSLHDALPICTRISLSLSASSGGCGPPGGDPGVWPASRLGDRESTRLNSSHRQKSYALFFFEKKKNKFIVPVVRLS